MSDAWERARVLAEKHAQAGGIFVRLANNGDKVVGAFCGDPHTREVVWTGDHFDTFDPTNEAQKDKRVSLRVVMNFFVPAEGKMKIIEGGTQWFKDVLKVRAKYGTDTWLFEIERHGEAGNTKTKYTILPETKIEPDMRARIAGAELHDLASLRDDDEDGEADPKARAGAKAAPAKPASSSGASAASTAGKGSSGPVDPSVALEIMEQLKALPRAEVEPFLQRFGIQRVRDLKATDEAAARNLLGELAQKHTPAGGAVEVDPFA